MTTASAMNFSERKNIMTNPTAKALIEIIDEKQTRLAVNCDVTKCADVLSFAEKVGPSICLLKTHADILEDFNDNFVQELQQIAKSYGFLIFEDRKFADIGSIVQKQYRDGMTHIASWADITNAHPVPGPGVIEGLKEVGLPLGRGLLLVAEMSSKGSLATGSYTDSAVSMAEEHSDFVIGFISQNKLTNDPRFLHMTPGVKLSEGGDSLGQQYVTPEKAIKDKGADIIIVGRGISQADDPTSEAERYRSAANEAL